MKGDGATAKAGSQIAVNYSGVAYSTGKEFDNSYDRGEPFELQLGAGMVIPGWDQGIEGMKVGGRRQLTIPPDLAYGAEGSAARHQGRRDADLRGRPAQRPVAPSGAPAAW